MERGTLVTLTGDNRHLHDDTESEIVYGIELSSTPNDSRILGAYLGLQETSDPAGPDNPHLVMAVGNGEMWVVDDGQDVEIGDYLISSNIAGHATVDRGEYEISYIVGRAAEAVAWDEADERTDDRRHRKISVLFESFTANHTADRIRTEHRRALAEIVVLTGAIQEQQESMQAENTALRAELDETRKMVESLATQVEALQERETMTQSKTSAVDAG